jgi:shikimate kinase
MGQEYTTDRRVLEQVDIARNRREAAARNLAYLQESGQLTARSAGPLVRGTREAMEAQLDFLSRTQAEPPGENEPPFQEWDWRTGMVNPAWVRQGISRLISKRGERYDPGTYAKAEAMLDYLFEPMTTPEQWDAYRKWALDPNASYAEMPPGAMVPELAVGFFNYPGAMQALRDIWRDIKEEGEGGEGGISWMTALDALGALPIAGALVTMAAHADDIGDAAKRFARLAEMDDLVVDAGKPGRAMPESKRLLKLADEDPEAFALMNTHRVEAGEEPISIERLTFVEQNRMERELPYEEVALGDQYVERRRLRDEVNEAYAGLERRASEAGPGWDRTKPGAWNPRQYHLVDEDEIILYRRTQEPAVLDPSNPASRNRREGAEGRRRENYGEVFPERTNWYTEDATVESQFHNFQHEVAVRVPRARLYDIEADALGWVKEAGPGGDFTLFERRVANHPDYDGIIQPSNGRVDVFSDMEANVLDRINLRTGDVVPVPEGSRASHERNIRGILDKYENEHGWVGDKYVEDYIREHDLPDGWSEGPKSDFLRDRYNMPDVESAERVDDGLRQASREVIEGELGTVEGETFRVMSLREDGQTIGQLKYSLLDDDKALISWIGVGEPHRRSGAATELWEEAMDRIGDRTIHINDLTEDGEAFVRRMGTEVEELGTLPSRRVGPFDSPEPSLAAHFAERQRLTSPIRITSRASGADVVANHFSDVGGAGGSSTRYDDAVNMGALDEGYVGALGERAESMVVASEADLTPEVIDEFISRNADRLGGEEGLAVGTWKNPETGEVEVDISRVFEDRDEAIRYAAANEHDAIWDLKGEKDIYAREHTGMEKYMTPEERVLYLGEDGFPEGKIVRMWGQAPTARELASAAGRGAAARGWYRASSAALVEVFGEDAPRFAAMLASLSPQTSVEENLKGTLLFWNRWDAAGRPTSRDAISEILLSVAPTEKGGAVGFDAAVVLTDQSTLNNLVRSATAQDPVGDFFISGAKVDSFHNNLMQDVNRVTMDTWGTKYLGMNPDHLNSRNATLAALQTPEYRRYMGTMAEALPVEDLPRKIEDIKPGQVRVEYTKKDGTIGEGIRRQGQHDAAGGIGVPSAGYTMGGTIHREAAELMTDLTGVRWTPEEVQETAWSLFKSVIDQDPTRPERWMDLLRETTDDQIAKAADFSTLLQEEGYRGLVEAGGRQAPGSQAHLRGADVPEGVVREADLESLMGRAQRHKAGEFDIPSLLLPVGGGSLLGRRFLQQREEERRGLLE